jgi:hypothetical protein
MNPPVRPETPDDSGIRTATVRAAILLTALAAGCAHLPKVTKVAKGDRAQVAGVPSSRAAGANDSTTA